MKTVHGETRRMEQTRREADERPGGVSKLETLAKDFLVPMRPSSNLPFQVGLLFTTLNYMTTPFPPQGGVQAGFQSHLRAPCPGHGLHRHTQRTCFLPLTHETPYSPTIMPFSTGAGLTTLLFFAIHDS